LFDRLGFVDMTWSVLAYNLRSGWHSLPMHNYHPRRPHRIHAMDIMRMRFYVRYSLRLYTISFKRCFLPCQRTRIAGEGGQKWKGKKHILNSIHNENFSFAVTCRAIWKEFPSLWKLFGSLSSWSGIVLVRSLCCRMGQWVFTFHIYSMQNVKPWPCQPPSVGEWACESL